MQLTFDKETLLFNDDVLNTSPPESLADRIRTFARLVAYGVMCEYWPVSFVVRNEGSGDEMWSTDYRFFGDTLLGILYKTAWKDKAPSVTHLELFGYADRDYSVDNLYTLTSAAINLLDQPLHQKAFISYRRSESTAFAMLLYDRLKLKGFDPFVDLQSLKTGDWHPKLETAIKNTDFFICLIQEGTLENSRWVRREIEWALQHAKEVIPVFYNGLTPETAKQNHQNSEYSEDIEELFSKHAITVAIEGDVNAYEGAIRQLLQMLEI